MRRIALESERRLAADWKAVADTAATNNTELWDAVQKLETQLNAVYAERDRAEDDLAAERALTRNLLAQSRFGALQPAPEPSLPTIARELDTAIRAKATGRNHRTALWAWAKERQKQGVSDVEIADAIAGGEADDELLIEQEAV